MTTPQPEARLAAILANVTPPQTWDMERCKCGDPICRTYFLYGPTKSEGRMAEANAAFIVRAARSFEPLVRALQAVQRLDYLQEHNALAKQVQAALAEALKP